MANLTITVDAAVLKRARIKAIEDGVSVNQYLADKLSEYVDDDAEQWKIDRERMFATWDRIAESQRGQTKRWTWNRDEIYDERLERFRA